MKKQLLFIFLALVGVFSNPSVLNAQCTITQNTDDFDYAVGSLTEIGQTFTACTGVLKSVQFKTISSFSGNVTLKIVQKSDCSTATNVANTKGTVTFSSALVGVNTVNFSPAISLTAGTYYLQFTSAANNGTLAKFKGKDDGATYAGGKAFYTSDLGTCKDDVDDIYFVVDMTGTLPVELSQFTANTEGSKNHLTWTTASETNNKGFDIERSRDGETFQAIGTVKAIGKAGNYNFTDAEPVNGTNYYRLRQIDYDGTETYSKVISVANKGGKSLKVYPTLVSNGILTIDTEGGGLQHLQYRGSASTKWQDRTAFRCISIGKGDVYLQSRYRASEVCEAIVRFF